MSDYLISFRSNFMIGRLRIAPLNELFIILVTNTYSLKYSEMVKHELLKRENDIFWWIEIFFSMIRE